MPAPPPLPLVRLRGASLTRGGVTLLGGLDFDLMPGARWAVLGENGAGKTSLLRLVRGDVPPDPPVASGGGKRIYVLPGPDGQPGEPQSSPLGLRQRLALVSSDMQDLYAVNGWAATGLEVILAGFTDALLLYGLASPEQRARAGTVVAELGLERLAARRMARLSTGEGRKILLARALAVEPEALLLDECLEGLDAPSRAEFLALLDRVAAARPGLALLFTSHRAGELPGCLERALLLEGGRAVGSGPLAEVLGRSERMAEGTAESAGEASGALAMPPAAPASPDFLARITGADVDIGGERILHAVHWTLRPGEHWAVLGANGAGKSTLLALLGGEHWPSALTGAPGTVEYGFEDPGETLDDLRRRIGVVSAALQAGYSYDVTALEAVCSGAVGSVGIYAEPGPEVRARAAELLEFFGIPALASRRIRTLSRGQLRRVLLARALVGSGGRRLPAMLLLDEPMAGLDAPARRTFRALLERVAGLGVALVLVTHHERDLPPCVDHVLALEAGRVAFCGTLAEHRNVKRPA